MRTRPQHAPPSQAPTPTEQTETQMNCAHNNGDKIPPLQTPIWNLLCVCVCVCVQWIRPTILQTDSAYLNLGEAGAMTLNGWIMACLTTHINVPSRFPK